MPNVSFAPRAASWGLLGLLALAGPAPAEERLPAPRTPVEELATLRLADPGLKIELVAAEPDVISPVAIAWDEGGRLFVAEMTDYPAGPTSGRIRLLEDRDGDGRYRAGLGLRRGARVPQRGAPLERRGPGHRGARHPLPQGHRRRRPRRRASRGADGIRRGEPAAPRQRPDLGARQLGLRRQRPERRRGPAPLRPSREGRLDRPQRLPLPAGDGRGRGRGRVQPVRPPARRSGGPVPLLEHDPDPARRDRGAGPEPQPVPRRVVVGGVDPRPVRRRARLRDQPDPGDVQPRVDRVFQRHLRPDDLPGRRARRVVPRKRLLLRVADEPRPAPGPGAGRPDLPRAPGRAGQGVPGVDRPRLPARQRGDRARRGPLRGRLLSGDGRASPVRPRGRPQDRRFSTLERTGADLADRAEAGTRRSLGGAGPAPGQGRHHGPGRPPRPRQRLVARHRPAPARRAAGQGGGPGADRRAAHFEGPAGPPARPLDARRPRRPG